MSTKEEQTLEIKDFRGVSRYLASPNQAPNKLYTIENLYSPNRGELAYVPGVVGASLASDGFSNLIADFNFNGQRLLFNQTTVGVLPNPITPQFTFASSGGSTTAYFRIAFVGMGYETDIANSPAFTVSSIKAATNEGTACGASVTLNAAPAIPNTVSAINFYIAGADVINQYVVCATLYRNNKGSFPSSYAFWAGLPIYDTSAPVTGQNYQVFDFTSVNFTPENITGGSLIPGTTYYFGFAPYVMNTDWTRVPILPSSASPFGPSNPYYYPTVQQAFWQTADYVAYTLPQGFNSINLSDAALSPLWDGVSGHTYHGIYIFCGASLEDMLFAQWIPGTINTQFFTGPISVSDFTGGMGITVTGITNSHNNGVTMLNGIDEVDSSVDTVRLGMYVPTQQIHKPGAESVACLAFAPQTLDYSVSSSSCYQINPCRGYGRYSTDANQSLSTPDLFRVFHGGTTPFDKLQGATFGGSTRRSNRFFMVNNFQLPFYTDGYSFKPIAQDFETVIPPICSNVIAFQNLLVMGGGPTGIQNIQGSVFWSQPDGAGNPDPFAWGQKSATPVNNSAALIGDSSGDILGFGVFSYNQAVNSVTTQIVVGFSNAIWMSPFSTEGFAFQEVARNVGFASANSMVNTNIGALFLGRDNLYQFNTYGIPVAKGQDFLTLIQSMTKSNTTVPPQVVYSQNQVKVMYSSGNATDPNTGALLYDQEIWCDVQLEKDPQSGADLPRFVWTGPHTINQIIASATFPTGVYTDISAVVEDYRTGCNSTRALVLNYPGKTSNQGSSVNRSIVFNDLYLGVDDFIKLFKRVYVGGKSTNTTTIAINFLMVDQDGAGEGSSGSPTAYTDSIVFNPNNVNPCYMQAQKLFTTRYRGRIISQLTFSWSAGSAEETINIYELALLFEAQKRRHL